MDNKDLGESQDNSNTEKDEDSKLKSELFDLIHKKEIMETYLKASEQMIYDKETEVIQHSRVLGNIFTGLDYSRFVEPKPLAEQYSELSTNSKDRVYDWERIVSNSSVTAPIPPGNQGTRRPVISVAKSKCKFRSVYIDHNYCIYDESAVGSSSQLKKRKQSNQNIEGEDSQDSLKLHIDDESSGSALSFSGSGESSNLRKLKIQFSSDIQDFPSGVPEDETGKFCHRETHFFALHKV